jgi:hypothetical protein
MGLLKIKSKPTGGRRSKLPPGWKRFPRNRKYLVSVRGDVRGPSNTICKPKWYKGNLYIDIRIDNKKTRIAIHHMVLETFVAPRPEGKEAGHLDGDKSNNTVYNLKWVTKSENMELAVKNKLLVQKKGKDSPMFGRKLKDGKFV